MAKSIGKFAVNIGANTRGFSKGLGRASGMAGGFSKSIGGMAVKLAGAAAGFLALKKIVGSIASEFANIDKLAKTTSKLGVSSIAALQGLRFAAQQTGADTNTLDMGLQRMTRRVAQAAQGGGEAVKALDELGLSAQGLNNMAPDEQFKAIADAMKEIKNPADQVRLTFALFDSEGVNLVNLLREGSGGVQSLLNEFDELGGAITSIDAAKIVESNDAWNRVKTAVTAVVRMLAVHLAPVLTNISTTFVEVAKVVVAKVKEWAPVFLAWTNVVFAALKIVFDAVSSVFSAIFGVISGNMGSALDFVIESLISLEFNIRNFESIATAAFLNVAASAIGFGAEIKHFFTGVLPALLGWFTKNWTGIWHTALDFVLTGFINLGQNIRNLFSAIWQFMKTGEWEVAFVPLTEGFRNMVQELPKIPKREIGPLEAGLRDEAAQIQAKLDTDFAVFREKRREELMGGDKIEIKKPDLKLPGGMAAGAGGTSGTASRAALERGSVEAFSAISKQIRGAQAKREEDNLSANERTAEATERLEVKFDDQPKLATVGSL